MARAPDEFDPNNITQVQMDKLATCLREFLDFFEECVVIPDDLKDQCEKDVKEGMKRVKRLIEKLEKGDRSVFKDEEQWNTLR